VLFPMTLIDP